MSYIPRSNPFQGYPKAASAEASEQRTSRTSSGMRSEPGIGLAFARKHNASIENDLSGSPIGQFGPNPKHTPLENPNWVSGGKPGTSPDLAESDWLLTPPPCLWERIKNAFMDLFFEEEPVSSSPESFQTQHRGIPARPIGLSPFSRATAPVYPQTVGKIVPERSHR